MTITAAKITIVMPTYNQEKYLEEAVDSVLMQQSNFLFHLIIVDDKSTDNSLNIALNYQQEYPHLITVLSNEQNKGCLYTTIRGYELAKTEYFCVLDPDDYWIDKNKLQRAIDFLDIHPDFVMHISNTCIDYGDIQQLHHSLPQNVDFDFNSLTSGVWGHTSGTIFRNVIFKHGVDPIIYQQIGTEAEKYFEGDSFRNIIHLKQGKAHATTSVEGVYRITGNGIWTGYNKVQQHTLNAGFYLKMFEYFDYIDPDYFLISSFHFCQAGFLLIANSWQENMSFKIADFKKLYKIFREILNHKQNYLLHNNDIHNSFIFFYPSNKISHTEQQALVFAQSLADTYNFKVYFITCLTDSLTDNLSDKQSSSKIIFINYTLNRVMNDLEKSAYLITAPMFVEKIPHYTNKHTKITIWCTAGEDQQILNQITNMKDLECLRAVSFIDGLVYEKFADAGYKFLENYIPIAKEANHHDYGVIGIIAEDTINIGWLVHVEQQDITCFINLMNDFYKLSTAKIKNIHILSDINVMLIEQHKYNDEVNIIYSSNLNDHELNLYITQKIDVVFASEFNSLISANLKTPTVIVSLDDSNNSNNLAWLFNIQKFVLQGNSHNISHSLSLAMIVNDIYIDNKKSTFGLQCYDHYNKFHNVDLAIGKLLSAVTHNGYTVELKSKKYKNKFREWLKKIYLKYLAKTWLNKYIIKYKKQLFYFL